MGSAGPTEVGAQAMLGLRRGGGSGRSRGGGGGHSRAGGTAHLGAVPSQPFTKGSTAFFYWDSRVNLEVSSTVRAPRSLSSPPP